MTDMPFIATRLRDDPFILERAAFARAEQAILRANTVSEWREAQKRRSAAKHALMAAEGRGVNVDLLELLTEAFNAGFSVSGEGYNGEYPFNYDSSRISRKIADQRKEAIQNILLDASIIVGGSND